MLQPSNPPRRRFAWLRPQFSLGTLFWLMLVTAMGVLWWKDRQAFDQRLKKVEQMYYPTYDVLWSAKDILGPPDDPTGGAGKSWCPSMSSAVDWVQVAFDKPVAAATIDLHETYSVGCVTKVNVVDRYGTETTIWSGTDPTPATARSGLFKVPVPASIKSVQQVKIHVDSTGRGSWACIDAVGLTTKAGKTTWATSSEASSVYGGSGLSATVEKQPWYVFW